MSFRWEKIGAVFPLWWTSFLVLRAHLQSRRKPSFKPKYHILDTKASLRFKWTLSLKTQLYIYFTFKFIYQEKKIVCSLILLTAYASRSNEVLIQQNDKSPFASLKLLILQMAGCWNMAWNIYFTRIWQHGHIWSCQEWIKHNSRIIIK